MKKIFAFLFLAAALVVTTSGCSVVSNVHRVGYRDGQKTDQHTVKVLFLPLYHTEYPADSNANGAGHADNSNNADTTVNN